MLIGISGKICAGKDFLSSILSQHNCQEINLDKIGHLALGLEQTRVLQAFPELQAEQNTTNVTSTWVKASNVVDPSLSQNNVKKTVDRKKLGDLVFRNPASLHKLEEILHPHMKELVLQELEKCSDMSHIVAGKHTKYMDVQGRAGTTNHILNAAILEKLGLLPLCQLVLWIEGPLYLRAQRAWQRDQLHLKKFLQRNWAQRSLKAPSNSRVPVFIIRNNKKQPETALTDILQQLEQIPQILNILEGR